MKGDGSQVKPFGVTDVNEMENRSVNIFEKSMAVESLKESCGLFKDWFSLGVKIDKQRIIDLNDAYEKAGLKADFMNHVTDEKLQAFEQKQIIGTEKENIEAHLYLCKECAARMLELYKEK